MTAIDVRADGAAGVHSSSVELGRFGTLAAAASVASIEAARAVTFVATTSYWRSTLQASGADPDLIAMPDAPCGLLFAVSGISQAAVDYGNAVSGLPAPAAAEKLGELYSHSLPGPHRKRDGVFYTPLELVRRLVDQATAAGVDWRRARVLSPACGAGQFLVEDAVRMVAAMGDTDPAIIVNSIGGRLRGWDIDPFACWLSQVLVEATLFPLVLASGKRLPKVTECRDSLFDDWSAEEGSFDLVNENPAFGKIPSSGEISSRYGRSVYGHPNLYALFADLALRLAKPSGGVVSLLTPTSYLSGKYFRNLRRTLVQEAAPVSVDLVESRADVFPDVLQEVAISTFVRGGKRARATTASIRVARDGLTVSPSGELALPHDPLEPWLLAREPDDASLVAALATMPTRLSDVGYRVATGPLVWNRAAAKGLLHDEGGAGRHPIVWADSIGANGNFELHLQKHDRKRWYRSPARADSRKDPNLVGVACVLLQRTTAKEQKRRLIGAVLGDAVLRQHRLVAVENHVNMVVPTGEIPAIPLEALSKFFTSRVADRIIRCISGSVALSASEIEAMPLPSVGALRKALAASDPEAALSRLYGIDNGRENQT